jgi:signal transduction histidine kinase
MTTSDPPSEKDIQGILSAMEELLFDQNESSSPVESSLAAPAGPSKMEPEASKAGWERSATLFDMAAHDLRSPLSAIVLYVEHLLQGDDGPLNDEQARILQVITENTKRLANFINNLIDLHKISSGKLKFKCSPQPIDSIVSEMVELYQVVAERAGIQLQVQIAGNIPTVWGNGPKIEQVIINLLSNALKFTHKGGQVNVRLEAIENQDVQFSIQDNGPGIPAEDLKELFKHYSEIDMDRHHRIVRGTGLGLLISKEIMDVQGGKIWAESWPGRGSIFYFSLPHRSPEGGPASPV